MKKLSTLCASLILAITLSNCKKDEVTPEKCTPPAAPKSTNNSPVAVGDTLRFTAASIPGATYSWTGPNGFTSSKQNPSFIYKDSLANGEYLVTATVNGCTSDAYHTYVTNTNITATNEEGTLTTKTLSLHASDFKHYGSIIPATYDWKGPNGFTSTLQDPIITGVTIDAAGTYSVTATAISNGKKSNEATTIVVITPIGVNPTSNSPVSAPISVDSTLKLTVATITGATSYNWTGPDGFISTLQNPTISNVTKAAEGTYEFYYTLSAANTKSVVTKVAVGIKYSKSGCRGQASVIYKGITYNTVEIGTQCWLKENLQNKGVDSLTWGEMTSATAVSNQGACPTGWHLPNDTDWKDLAMSASVNGDGNTLKEIGQGTGAGAGTNTSGFSALLELQPSKASAIFWSTTQVSSAPRYMQLDRDTPLIYYNTGNPAKKYSVRCLKD